MVTAQCCLKKFSYEIHETFFLGIKYGFDVTIDLLICSAMLLIRGGYEFTFMYAISYFSR